jgi:hypothetical protein
MGILQRLIIICKNEVISSHKFIFDVFIECFSEHTFSKTDVIAPFIYYTWFHSLSTGSILFKDVLLFIELTL